MYKHSREVWDHWLGPRVVRVYVLPPSEVDFEFVYTAAHTAPNQTIPFILPLPEVDFEFMYMATHRRLTKQYRSPCANVCFTWLKYRLSSLWWVGEICGAWATKVTYTLPLSTLTKCHIGPIVCGHFGQSSTQPGRSTFNKPSNGGICYLAHL